MAGCAAKKDFAGARASTLPRGRKEVAAPRESAGWWLSPALPDRHPGPDEVGARDERVHPVATAAGDRRVA